MYQMHGATCDTRMDADARDVDVDAPIRVQQSHSATPEATIVHMRADGETERLLAIVGWAGLRSCQVGRLHGRLGCQGAG
jgi:hypothetical protein